MAASHKYSRLVEQGLNTDNTQLKLENTKIKKKYAASLFKALHSLSSLTSLEIKSCRLKKIPAEVNLLSNLRVLKVEDNLIQDLPNMSGMTSLRELSLSANDLRNFPISVASIPSLTSLDLTSNSVAWIPGAVAHLTSLMHLSLENNSLPYFPIPVSLLSSLQIFNCNSNGLRVFPSQVLQLPHLQALIMSQNMFQYVPSELQDIKQTLTYLDLSDNSISKLPAEMGSLVVLKTLLLQHNKIAQLPYEMGDMVSLVSLKLHDNHITSIPDSFGKLINLVELYLQENELSCLPPQLGECASLRKLRLEYNKIRSLPEAFSKMSKLNVLMAHDNCIHEVPQFLYHPHFLRHLLRITLHDNRFSDSIHTEIIAMGALNFLLQWQEACGDNLPSLYSSVKKTVRKDTIRRTTRVSTGERRGSLISSDEPSPSADGHWLGTNISPTRVLTPTARRRAASLDDAIPPQNDNGTWKSNTEMMRSRSASVGSYLAPPPYRTFQGVYEYLVDELDLSGKRREELQAMAPEDKWKLLSSISRESSQNLLMTNSKVRCSSTTATISPASSAPSSPMVSRTNIPSLNLGEISSPSFSPRSPRSPTKNSKPKLPPRSPRSTGLNSPIVSAQSLSPNNINLESVAAIKECLTTQSVARITAFAESGGVEHILQVVKVISSKIEKSAEDYKILLETLSCVTILLGIGLESLLISDVVEIVAVNIISDYLPLCGATIDVLDEVCNVFYIGQGLVIDAMKNLCTKNNQNPTDIFVPLYNIVASSDTPNLLKVNTMKLINNLITNTDELEERCKIRNNFLQLGMNETIQCLKTDLMDRRERTNLMYQIDEFEELMSDDCEEIAARFKLNQLQFSPDIVENAIQNTALRVVLPSVSHERMTCVVETYVCDHTTTTRDVIVGLCSQTNSLPIKECGEYALFVPAAYAKSKEASFSETGYLLDDKRRVLHYALDGVILELRLKPWKLTVVLCESILASKRNALNMVDLRNSLETALAKRESRADIHNGAALITDAATTDNGTPRSRHAPSRSTGTLLERPKLLVNGLNKSTSSTEKPSTKSGDTVVGEVSVDTEPNSTCDSVVGEVLRKFHGDKPYELDDFALFLPKDKNSGVWLEPTEKLATYGHAVTQVKIQLRLMPKTLKIRLTEDTFELVSYDESTPVRTIINDMYKRAVVPSNRAHNSYHASQYGMLLGEDKSDCSSWLDPEKKLKYYALPNRATLRFALKPKSLIIVCEMQKSDDGLPMQIQDMVPFHLPIKEILNNLKVPLDGAAVFLYNEKNGMQLLDVELSLFDQNVNENSTLLVKPATEEISLVDPASVNIWEEPENANTIVYNTENLSEIHAATLNKIVERLTSEKDHDQVFTQVFLATYKTFTTDEMLFNKLVERYNIPEHRINTIDHSVMRLRVIVFLKNWLESFASHNNSTSPHSATTHKVAEELSSTVCVAIDKFIDTCLSRDGYTALAVPLKKMLKTSGSPPIAAPSQSPRGPDFRMCNPMRLAHGFTWLVDEWDLAYQLTVREFKIYAQIKGCELLGDKDHGPAVQHMISNFNHVAAWVPTAVLAETKLSQRARVLDRFIKLAAHLRELNNFHLLTAVLSGINSSSVSRLKWTLAKIPKRSKQVLSELEALMAMEGSYKHYRIALENAAPPCVPYIGVYLTDLVFIEDGNPNKVGNMINCTKRRYMYNIVDTVRRYQCTSYDEAPASTVAPYSAHHVHASGNSTHLANITAFLTFLYRMPLMTDKQLYDLSLSREPRNAERHDIL